MPKTVRSDAGSAAGVAEKTPPAPPELHAVQPNAAIDLTPRESMSVPHGADPDLDRDIAREAYALYCERGYVDGRDFDDWIEAERRLRERREAADPAGPGGPVS